MTVILCEKPNDAKYVSKFLKTTKKGKGYFFNDEFQVTWSFGHLFSLTNANEYTDDPWNLDNLPIFPDRFKYKLYSDKKAQFEIIKSLFLKADKIINATDSGREGELIFRYIYNHCKGATKNIYRFWSPSLTPEGIKTAFNNMKPSSFYDNLYYSGLARNHADWLIGINSTVAFTKTLNSYKALPLGRVQTPTFAAVAKRFKDNKDFIPSKYFIPLVELIIDKDTVNVHSVDKILKEEETNAVINAVSDTLTCISSEQKEIIEKQPLLFDLTSLQIKANQIFKFTAAETLLLAQSLYDTHKVLSYPRTDSNYISEDVYNTLPDLFKKLKPLSYYDKFIVGINLSDLPKSSVNEKKITDHHALIPTGLISDALNSNEQKLFDLIVSQFFAVFSDVCKKESVTALFVNDNFHKFVFKGHVIKKSGWRSLIPDKNSLKGIFNFVENQSYSVHSKKTNPLFTKPPSLFSDSSLLKFMQSCGKEFTSDVIPSDIKSKGIGTPDTRSGIIEKILYSDYVMREKNLLIPTSKGLKIYDLIKDFKISSVDLTGHFEEKLNFIENGTYQYSQFIDEIKILFSNTFFPEIKSLKNSDFLTYSVCPKCKHKTLSDNGKLFSCSSDGCNFKLWKSFYKNPLSADQLKDLLSMKKVILKKIKSKKFENSFYSVELFLNKDEDFELSYNYIKPKPKQLELICPFCGNALVEHKNFYGCSNYADNCSFTVTKNFLGFPINIDSLTVLLSGKSVSGNFISKKGKKFSAGIKFDEKFKFEFLFDNQ